MRRIVLFISIISLSLSCSDSEDVGVEYSSIASLWRYVDECTQLITDDIRLCGSIVANDAYGEFNRAIVVMDKSGGVMIELDMEDIHHYYPLYSEVEVCCSGLWLGRVGPKLILGAEPTEEYVVDRIPAEVAHNRVKVLYKNNDTPTIRPRKVAELEYRDVLSCIELDGLRLVDSEKGLSWGDVDPLISRYITTVRHFVQGSDTLRVVTDAECHYAADPIPQAELNVMGVVDWYDNDIALRIAGCYVVSSN